MKPEQERVQNLLKDTVTTLCRNSLLYNRGIKVQGLLGITLDDDDVFLVHFNEIFQGLGSQEVTIQQADSVNRGLDNEIRLDTDSENSTEDVEIYQQVVTQNSHRKPSRRKAQPWRAVGGLSEPTAVSSAKKSSLSYNTPKELASKEAAHSIIVDEADNNNNEDLGYSMSAYDNETEMSEGDVGIMKQSYMQSADDTTEETTIDNSSTHDLSSTSLLRDIAMKAEESEADFIQGGPFISGVAQMPSGQCYQYPVAENSAISGLSGADLVQVMDGMPEGVAWDQAAYPVSLGAVPMDGRRTKRDSSSSQDQDTAYDLSTCSASPELHDDSQGQRASGMMLPVRTNQPSRNSRANANRSTAGSSSNQGGRNQGGRATRRTGGSAKGMHKCGHCGKTYWSRNTLVRHQKIHDPDLYACKKCTLFFSSEDKLIQHDRMKHQGPAWGRYTCQKCHKKFRSNNHLISHMNAFHSKSSS